MTHCFGVMPSPTSAATLAHFSLPCSLTYFFKAFISALCWLTDHSTGVSSVGPFLAFSALSIAACASAAFLSAAA